MAEKTIRNSEFGIRNSEFSRIVVRSSPLHTQAGSGFTPGHAVTGSLHHKKPRRITSALTGRAVSERFCDRP
jgi:hypothetical protein